MQDDEMVGLVETDLEAVVTHDLHMVDNDEIEQMVDK